MAFAFFKFSDSFIYGFAGLGRENSREQIARNGGQTGYGASEMRVMKKNLQEVK